MKKVLGIGGIFFKSQQPEALNDWYKTYLGFDTTSYGARFSWRDQDTVSKPYSTQWTPFSEDTAYFAPSKKEFMINYIVADIDQLVSQLKKEGIKMLDDIDTTEYGKFVHLLDPEGNKIELWEPIE